MSPRPLIFVSAVSRELRSARQLVANTLTFLGYQPVWQDIFGTEGGDLRGMLRQQIDQCKGVLQLIGKNYGAEPPVPDEEFGRVSYTQYEALYARKRGKKVWYLFIDETFPIDISEPEPEELRHLQSEYRRTLQSDTHVYHSLTTIEGLEASVLKLRDDLTQLRRGVKQWALGITALLLIIVALISWQLHGQAELKGEIAKLREGIMKYPRMEALAWQAQISESGRAPKSSINEEADSQAQFHQDRATGNQAALEERVYAELGKQLGLDPKVLREKLPKFAQELKQSPKAPIFERANAAYVTKDYVEAERLGLQAANEAEKSKPLRPSIAVAGLKLAGLSAQKLINYDRAAKHFHEAEKLTDRDRRPEEWTDVQQAIADLLIDEGQYSSAEKTLQGVVLVRTHVLGPEHPDTLRSRNRIAYALYRQGKYTEAESGFREVITAEEKVLGREDADTLASRHGAANALLGEGKYAEAETQYRQILALRDKVLGPEHPDTLRTRGNLASAFLNRGKYADAETELRQVLTLREKVLGPIHPDTLGSRDSLAAALGAQGKYAEASAEFRQVLNLREKVLGREHPDTLGSRNNLAVMLQNEGKYAEAETQFRELIKLQAKVLGPENPDALSSRNNLADALAREGKYIEAEAEISPVVKLRETISGAENPETLGTRDTLANALAGEGKYAEAEAQYRDLIRLEEKVLGPEHPITLSSRNGLARALMDQGKDAEAEMRNVIRAREIIVGPAHPDTLESCYDFARGLLRQKKIVEAKEFAHRAADGARKILGPDHPSTLKYEKLLADFQAKR